jgi:glycosyltransferase involved in cell wall biosynthesis
MAERLLGRFTDRLIAMSEEEARIALRHKVVSADRVRVVRNGVAVDRMPDAAAVESKRMELGWGPRGTSCVVGTVAKMNLQKDPLTWLRAVARAAERRPELRFVWVMGGELEPEVLGLARRLGLERNGLLQFFGHRPDAREIIGAMDVFSLSSVFEAGLPYVLMEAMLQERPVVATAASGSRELMRDGVNSLVAPCGDAEALAAGMLRLAEDPPLRSRLGRAGRETVLRLCTTERQVKETTGIYRELLSAHALAGAARGGEMYARF